MVGGKMVEGVMVGGKMHGWRRNVCLPCLVLFCLWFVVFVVLHFNCAFCVVVLLYCTVNLKKKIGCVFFYLFVLFCFVLFCFVVN